LFISIFQFLPSLSPAIERVGERSNAGVSQRSAFIYEGIRKQDGHELDFVSLSEYIFTRKIIHQTTYE